MVLELEPVPWDEAAFLGDMRVANAVVLPPSFGDRETLFPVKESWSSVPAGCCSTWKASEGPAEKLRAETPPLRRLPEISLHLFLTVLPVQIKSKNTKVLGKTSFESSNSVDPVAHVRKSPYAVGEEAVS